MQFSSTAFKIQNVALNPTAGTKPSHISHILHITIKSSLTTVSSSDRAPKMVHVKKTHNSKQSPMYMLMIVPVSPPSVQFIALLCVSAVHSATLFLNVMACLAYFTADAQNGVDFGLSILWFLLFTPVSFICWYRPVYKAFRYAGLVALRWNILNFALQTGSNCFVLQAEEIGTYADEVVSSVSFFFFLLLLNTTLWTPSSSDSARGVRGSMWDPLCTQLPPFLILEDANTWVYLPTVQCFNSIFFHYENVFPLTLILLQRRRIQNNIKTSLWTIYILISAKLSFFEGFKEYCFISVVLEKPSLYFICVCIEPLLYISYIWQSGSEPFKERVISLTICPLCRLFVLSRSDSSFSFFFFFFVFFFQVAVYIIQCVGIPKWGNRWVERFVTACWVKDWRCGVDARDSWSLLLTSLYFHYECVHCAVGRFIVNVGTRMCWCVSSFTSMCLCVFPLCIFSFTFLWQIPADLTCLGCCFVSVGLFSSGFFSIIT